MPPPCLQDGLVDADAALRVCMDEWAGENYRRLGRLSSLFFAADAGACVSY